MGHTLDTSIRYPDDATSVNAANPVNASITLAAGATAVAVGLIVGGGTARAGTAPTFGGITMLQANATQKAATSPESSVELWYLVDPPTGAQAIAVPNSNTNNIKVVAASFIAGGAGANTSRYDTANGANATSTNPTVAVSAAAGTAVIAIYGDGLANCVTGTANDSGTNLYKFDLGSYGGMSQYTLNANAGTVTLSYTANSDDWCAVAVSFKEDARNRGNMTQTLADTTITANGTVANATVKFNLAASGNIPANSNTATTAQLIAPANKTSNDFGAGWIADDTNPLASVNTTANQYTELEWCISANAAVSNGQVYTFRVTDNGNTVNTYSSNATWTIGTTVSNANVTQTLDATTLTANGAVGVNAAVAQTLAATAPTATGTVSISGSVSQTLDSTTPTVNATVAVAAVVQQTLADASLSAAATVLVAGTVEPTLDATDITATGTVETPEAPGISATVSQTLEDTATASTGTVAVAATVDATLAETVPTATGAVAVTASTDATLADTTPTATVSVQVKATTSQTLAATTPDITTGVVVKGSLSQTLASTAISSNATAAAAFMLSASANIAANAATATVARLTPPVNKTANADFQAGKISDDTNPLPSIDLVTNRYTELEWALQSTAVAVNTATYSFRVTANGTAVNTYSVTPTWLLLNAISANVAQTLAPTTITANAVQADVGAANATVTQTLQNVTQGIAAVTGRSATADSTLGNVSETKLHSDTSGLSGGTPTGYNFYFGRSSGTTDTIVPVAYEANLTILLASIAPALGEWYVRVRAYNATGESDFSNEVFVVVPAFTATVTNPAGNGTVSQTLGTTAVASSAKVAVKTQTIQTLAATTPEITGAVAVKATVSQTLGTVAASTTGTVETHATVEQTLADTGCAAIGAVYYGEANGTIESTLDDTAITASAVVADIQPILAWVDTVLANALTSAEADVLVSGTVDEDLAGVTPTVRGHAGTIIRMNVNTLLDGSEVDVR